MGSENSISNLYQFDDQGRPIIPEQEELIKLPDDGGELWNRLVFESSPYLLQHAANPVNWYPWGDEAFKLAKELNKPVFLSIGYTTCHWCHVMEHESFENDEVASLMNDAFICIKVDREERPDIDNVYMEITQMMNNRGGWPMTVIMTPDKKPFFSGTYFPKHSRGRRIGMMELIPRVKDAWNNSRDSLKTDADRLTNRLQRNQVNRTSVGEISPDVMERAYQAFQNRYDEKLGARPLRRAVEKYLEDNLAESLLAGTIKKSKPIEVLVSEDGESLCFEQNKPESKVSSTDKSGS